MGGSPHRLCHIFSAARTQPASRAHTQGEGAFPLPAPTCRPPMHITPVMTLPVRGPRSPPCFAALAYPALLAMQPAHLHRTTLICVLCHQLPLLRPGSGFGWIINCMVNNEIRDPADEQHGSALICPGVAHAIASRSPSSDFGGFMLGFILGDMYSRTSGFRPPPA